MNKTLLVCAGITIVSLTAFAGKQEREYWKEEVTPAVDKAKSTFKSACGCALGITAKEDGFKTTDQMAQVRNISKSIAEGAPGYCTDATSKKAMCAMKTLEITVGKETKFTFGGGIGHSVTDGQSFMDWEVMTRELDK